MWAEAASDDSSVGRAEDCSCELQQQLSLGRWFKSASSEWCGGVIASPPFFLFLSQTQAHPRHWHCSSLLPAEPHHTCPHVGIIVVVRLSRAASLQHGRE
ncbi:hypothetical protein [Echinococcus multilocularis]|uniref:Uncharacterized protein n=1 Tax=Echinococcus multilocularis TaxID=6211 RepID=A0A068YA14_ECHMU|nr:hypothetical protein [Echinococcus multilocularis]